MAVKENKTISQESAAAALNGSEQLSGVQAGNNVRIGVSQLATFVGAVPGGGGAVASVNARVGVVVLNSADVNLGSVNNTADSAKPVSTAQAAADTVVANAASAALTVHASNTANPHGVTAAQIGALAGSWDAPGAIGTTTPQPGTFTALTLSGNISAPAWTTAGLRFKGIPGTLTDTSSLGTVPIAYTDSFGGNTIAASNATTFTNYFTAFFKEGIAGPNVTMANKWALGAESIRVGTSGFFAVTNAGVVSATNLSATNTGDNATNSQYSGLAASKQDTLVSGTNIKTINGNPLPGAGNIVISGGAPGGAPTQLLFNSAGVSAGSAAIRAAIVTGSGGFTDTTNARLMVGVAGNAVCLHGNFGEMYLLNETATGYANINVDQIYAVNRVLTNSIIAPNNTYCAASSTAFTYSGFRAGSGSGMWWASTSNGANNDAVIETGFVRDAAGVIGVSLVAGGYGDFKAKNFVVDNVVKLKVVTVATLASAPTSGAGAQAYVTDALTPAYNTTVAAGGAVKIVVVSDGTNWKT